MINRNIFLLLLFTTIILSCSDGDNPVDYDSDALKIAGKYEAATFILPGDGDESVDIIYYGGSINIELFGDKKVNGKIIVPEIPRFTSSGFEENVNGNFEINNDTLKFTNMSNLISNPQLFFIINSQYFECDFSSFAGTYKIILKKIK